MVMLLILNRLCCQDKTGRSSSIAAATSSGKTVAYEAKHQLKALRAPMQRRQGTSLQELIVFVLARLQYLDLYGRFCPSVPAENGSTGTPGTCYWVRNFPRY